jgi:hypothetical protein
MCLLCQIRHLQAENARLREALGQAHLACKADWYGKLLEEHAQLTEERDGLRRFAQAVLARWGEINPDIMFSAAVSNGLFIVDGLDYRPTPLLTGET